MHFLKGLGGKDDLPAHLKAVLYFGENFPAVSEAPVHMMPAYLELYWCFHHTPRLTHLL